MKLLLFNFLNIIHFPAPVKICFSRAIKTHTPEPPFSGSGILRVQLTVKPGDLK